MLVFSSFCPGREWEKLIGVDASRQEWTLRVYLGHLDGVYVDRVLLPNDETHKRSGDELHRRRSRWCAHFPVYGGVHWFKGPVHTVEGHVPQKWATEQEQDVKEGGTDSIDGAKAEDALFF